MMNQAPLKSIFVWTLAVGLLLSLGIGAVVADEEDSPGISVGEKAAAFTLSDQNGKQVSLQSLIKDGEVLALVFHRSADW